MLFVMKLSFAVVWSSKEIEYIICGSILCDGKHFKAMITFFVVFDEWGDSV